MFRFLSEGDISAPETCHQIIARANLMTHIQIDHFKQLTPKWEMAFSCLGSRYHELATKFLKHQSGEATECFDICR